MGKKNKKILKPEQPTIFVIAGSIMHYEHGSMLELYSQITDEEWEDIVANTVKYSVFLECLKETAAPLLRERWNEVDEWFRIQLNLAVSRLRNIDPLLVAKHNIKDLKKQYTKQMAEGADVVNKMIDDIRSQVSNLKDQSIISDL